MLRARLLLLLLLLLGPDEGSTAASELEVVGASASCTLSSSNLFGSASCNRLLASEAADSIVARVSISNTPEEARL